MFSSTLYSRFSPPVARNLKKLDAEGSRRVRLNSQQPCPHIWRRGLLDMRFLCFSCFDNVFSLQKCLQIAVFLYLYPLEQCAPSHLSIFNLLYHPPSLPTVPPLLLKAFILKGMKDTPFGRNHHREFPPPPYQFRAHLLPAHVGL